MKSVKEISFSETCCVKRKIRIIFRITFQNQRHNNKNLQFVQTLRYIYVAHWFISAWGHIYRALDMIKFFI